MSRKPPAQGTLTATGWFEDEPADIQATLTFLAGGFGLLTSLLGFFGIQAGAVDDLVRAEPLGAVSVLVMIGLGVALALVTPTLKYARPAPLLFPAIALSVASLACLLVLPGLTGARNSDNEWWSSWGVLQWIGFLAYWSLIVFLLIRTYKNKSKWTAPLPVLALISSIALVGVGLLGAVVILTSRLSFPSVPAVSAVVESGVLSGTVNADVGGSGDEVVIFAVGIAPGSYEDEQQAVPQDTLLARKIASSDRNGVLESNLSTPIDAETWSKIRIYACRQRSTPENQASAPQATNPTSATTDLTTTTSPSQGDSTLETAADHPDAPIGSSSTTLQTDLIGRTNADLTASDQCGWADVLGTRPPSRLPADTSVLATGDISPSSTGDESLIVTAHVQAKNPERTATCLIVDAMESGSWQNLRAVSGSASSLSPWEFSTSIRSDEWQSAATLRLVQMDSDCSGAAEATPEATLKTLALYNRPTVATTTSSNG